MAVMEVATNVVVPARRSYSATAFTPEQQALVELEAEITELWGYINVATYRFLCLIAEFDRRKAHERHGLVSTAQWLNWQCGIQTGAAREKVRTARALENLPAISASFAKGEISYSKVRAMTRVATPANESVLLSIALHGTASHVEKLVRKYRWTQRRDAAKEAHAAYLNRAVHYFYDTGDTMVLHARLPREIGALFVKALEIANHLVREGAPDGLIGQPRVSAETPRGGVWREDERAPSPAVRRADALKLMAETFLACRSEEVESTASADRYQVVVHVDQAVVVDEIAACADEPHRCELEDGPALALDTARRLGCDCTVVGLVEGRDGEPLNIGRKTRIIPQAIHRALRARDGGCRFPGCDRKRFCEGHHVKHWADGGETKLENLVLLCGFHHTKVHEGGFGVTRTDDGVFVFTRPDGRRIPECGPAFGPVPGAGSFRGNFAEPEPRPDGDDRPGADAFEQALRFHLRRRDPSLEIDAQTSRCRWLGERMDYSLAIEGLQWHDRALTRQV
jgi:hypothetical protein